MTQTSKPLAFALVLVASTLAIGAGDNPTARVDSLGDPLPPDAMMRLGTLRFQPPSSVIELAVSPDGMRVVTIGREWLIVWDAATGKELWRASDDEGGFGLPGASYGIRALAFAPDGKTFFTPAGPHELKRWSIETGESEPLVCEGASPRGEPRLPIRLGRGGPCSVDLSGNGGHLAIGDRNGLVLSDPSGKALHRFRNSPARENGAEDMNRDRLTFVGDYSYAVFSPDGEQLAAVLSEAPKEVRMIDVESGQEVRRIPATANLIRIAFSPDGNQIATTQRDCSARSYAVATGEETWAFEIEPAPRAESYTSALAYSPEGETLAVCAPIGSDYSIYLLDAATGERRHKMTGHGWKPWAVAFSPDGKIIYSSGWAGTIQRWDPATGNELPLPEGVRASGVVAASPVAPLLAYEDGDNQIRLVDSRSGKELHRWEVDDANFEQVAFSPDGKSLAAGGTLGDRVFVGIWDVDSHSPRRRWHWPKGRDEHSGIESLRFSHDSQRLAAAVFRQSRAYVWDLASGQQTAALNHRDVYGLSFHPNGKTLVTVGWDSHLREWDLETGEQLSAVKCKGDDKSLDDRANAADVGAKGVQPLLSSRSDDLRMYTVDHSPDGRLLATGHMNNTVRVWQADGLLYRGAFQLRSGFPFDTLRFSPDSLWIACGHSGGGLTLWDAHARQRVFKTRRHQDNVYNVSFGRNARELVTGSSDGVCYLWDLRPHPRMLSSGRDLSEAPADELWDITLAGGEEAYHATWALADKPDEAIPLLREKLLAIKHLVDTEYLDPNLPAERAEAPRLEREFRLAMDPTSQPLTTATRALAVLMQIDSPESKALLQEIATGKHGQLSRLAAQRLAGAE